MGGKKHKSALAVLLPGFLAERVQRMREKYDDQCSKWMPNLCIFHPFVSRELLGNAMRAVFLRLRGCHAYQFDVQFSRLAIVHRGVAYCIYAYPDNASKLMELRERIGALFPRCYRTLQYTQFPPHITIGQFRSSKVAAAALAECQRSWSPVVFRVEQLHYLAYDAVSECYHSVAQVELAPSAKQGRIAMHKREKDFDGSRRRAKLLAMLERFQKAEDEAKRSASSARWNNSFAALDAAPDADSIDAELQTARHESARGKRIAKFRRWVARIAEMVTDRRAQRAARRSAPSAPDIVIKGRRKMSRKEKEKAKLARTPYLRDVDAIRDRARREAETYKSETRHQDNLVRAQIVKAQHKDTLAAIAECYKAGFITREQRTAFEAAHLEEARRLSKIEFKAQRKEHKKMQVERRKQAIKEGRIDPAAPARERTISEQEAVKLDELKIEGFIGEAEFAERTMVLAVSKQLPERLAQLEEELDMFVLGKMGPLGARLADSTADCAHAVRGRADLPLVGEEMPHQIEAHMCDQLTRARKPSPLTEQLLGIIKAAEDNLLCSANCSLFSREKMGVAQALLNERPALVRDYIALAQVDKFLRNVRSKRTSLAPSVRPTSMHYR